MAMLYTVHLRKWQPDNFHNVFDSASCHVAMHPPAVALGAQLPAEVDEELRRLRKKRMASGDFYDVLPPAQKARSRESTFLCIVAIRLAVVQSRRLGLVCCLPQVRLDYYLNQEKVVQLMASGRDVLMDLSQNADYQASDSGVRLLACLA